jgi:hypothetical protein
MELFETYFGPYPYRDEKYGHMEFDFLVEWSILPCLLWEQVYQFMPMN